MCYVRDARQLSGPIRWPLLAGGPGCHAAHAPCGEWRVSPSACGSMWPHLCRLLGRDLLAHRLDLLQEGDIEGAGGLGQLLHALDGRIGDCAKADELGEIHGGYQRVIQMESHCASKESEGEWRAQKGKGNVSACSVDARFRHLDSHWDRDYWCATRLSAVF